MRPILFGLLAAFMAATILPAAAVAATAPAPPKPPEITADARNQGKKDTPALITAAALPCKVSDARFIGPTTDPKTKKTIKYYEVACSGAMGFIVVDQGAPAPPSWASCLDQPKTDPLTGKINGAACFLPGNSDDLAVLTPFIAKSKVACDPATVRGIGHSDKAAYFEIACKSGQGFVLSTSAPPSIDQPVTMIPCLSFDATSPVSCKLTTPASQLALIDALDTQSTKACEVANRRYILTAQDFSSYYEIACKDGKGYVLHQGADGKLIETIDCAVADHIGDGCTFTNSREAQTEQAGLYSKLAHSAGFACDVSKYGPINANIPDHEVVELACSNRPDGAIAIFPALSSQPSVIYDCAHSELVGYRCGFTKPEDALPHLTADLQKLGKTSCVASGVKTVGTSTADKLGYLEIACADGNPGYMVSYNLGDMSPKEAIACAAAKDLNGGCTLPTDRVK